jgi:UTP--glucose-1-phosphate uridylyltransferase
LSIRSDRFIFSNENTPVLNSKVRSKIIQIDLEPKYYGKIDLFDERFIHGIPSLMDCESLTIRGDVRFERNVTIKGRVVITNNLKSQMVVKEGTVLDKDVIFN